MDTVNVGIVGVGNCASSLVQGVQYYSQTGTMAGLTNPLCGGYRVSDIRFTSAFDVDVSKLNCDLSDAIWCDPNNAQRFATVPALGVPVVEGARRDGIGQHYSQRISVQGEASKDDIVSHLQRTDTHVIVNFLPVGSQEASEFYAEAAVNAGCAFVNCIPSTIARSEDWCRRFEDASLPLIGDDLKSQFGATLIHRSLVDTLKANGVKIRNTYQILNGGNMDFFNMEDDGRMQSKKESKTQGILGTPLGNSPPSEEVHVGTEYIPFLRDRKIAFVRIEAEAFGGTLLELDLRMAVEGSPSAAGNVLDAVRYAKLAMDVGIKGVVHSVSSLLMKASPKPMSVAGSLAEIQSMENRVPGGSVT